jgi:hypothetical protein
MAQKQDDCVDNMKQYSISLTFHLQSICKWKQRLEGQTTAERNGGYGGVNKQYSMLRFTFFFPLAPDPKVFRGTPTYHTLPTNPPTSLILPTTPHPPPLALTSIARA